jgi:hypothetical protein
MRNPTETDIALAKDRLRGTGAWNGQGLLVHLALTSRKDPEREWMQPLADLCSRVVAAEEDGEVLELDDDQAGIFDDMAAYSETFHEAIAESRAADPE